MGSGWTRRGTGPKRLTISFQEFPNRSHFPECGASVAFDTFVAVLPEEQQNAEETASLDSCKLRKCNATASLNGQRCTRVVNSPGDHPPHPQIGGYSKNHSNGRRNGMNETFLGQKTAGLNPVTIPRKVFFLSRGISVSGAQQQFHASTRNTKGWNREKRPDPGKMTTAEASPTKTSVRQLIRGSQKKRRGAACVCVSSSTVRGFDDE